MDKDERYINWELKSLKLSGLHPSIRGKIGKVLLAVERIGNINTDFYIESLLKLNPKLFDIFIEICDDPRIDLTSNMALNEEQFAYFLKYGLPKFNESTNLQTYEVELKSSMKSIFQNAYKSMPDSR